MFPRPTRPAWSIIVLIISMLACNMPSAATKEPTNVPVDATKIALEIQATNNVQPPTQGVDATKLALEIQATNNVQPPTQGVDATKIALEIQATNNAPTPTLPIDATKVALQVQATDAAAQLTQQANQPTFQPGQPTSGLPATGPTQDYSARMKTAKILVYEDTPNIGNWISDTLDGMGLKYTFVGDAIGTLMINLNSPIDWDLIIIGAEAKSRVQGEFWDVISEKVTRDKAALIAEIWYLDLLGEGRIKPLLSNCGIQFQRDWPLAESIYWLDSTHPLFSDPNNAMPLINYGRYWAYQAGDLIRLSPGSNATLLAGIFQKRKSDYGVLATCFDGRVIFQTFSNHDYAQDSIIRLWQNYITYTLKNRFKAKP